jgi:hypothetical protein
LSSISAKNRIVAVTRTASPRLREETLKRLGLLGLFLTSGSARARSLGDRVRSQSRSASGMSEATQELGAENHSIGWRSGRPRVRHAPAFLTKLKAVIGELGLEGQLVSWVISSNVDPVAPDNESAESLEA